MELDMETLPENGKAEETSSTAVNVRVPKRVLHFSDGTVEEYSDDEVDDAPKDDKETVVVDPKTLTWGPWMIHKVTAAGSSTLAACDYVGESLASMLGITTPKYHFEIEEYKRREEEKKKDDEARKGWSENTVTSTLVTKECVEGPTAV